MKFQKFTISGAGLNSSCKRQLWLIPLSQGARYVVWGAVRRRAAAGARGHSVARARSLTEFQASFPDEASCAAFLFGRRWPQGFVCPVCGGGRAAVLKSRAYTYECLGCGRQTSITAGTVMHRSKLPLTVWFWAAHLMATHSNGMSAVQFEAQPSRTKPLGCWRRSSDDR